MDLVNALRFCILSAILSLTLMLHVVVAMAALVFNNQVNNNFQYKLHKLFVASTVGFHNSIISLHKSVHQFFRLLLLIFCAMSTIFISSDFFNPPLHSKVYSLRISLHITYKYIPDI